MVSGVSGITTTPYRPTASNFAAVHQEEQAKPTTLPFVGTATGEKTKKGVVYYACFGDDKSPPTKLTKAQVNDAIDYWKKHPRAKEAGAELAKFNTALSMINKMEKGEE
jgi:hypothetical protein